jgi:adenylosuccinate lyase
MSEHDRYSSPLAERYASKAMLSLWSPAERYGQWRRLWLALAQAERELGVPIPDVAITEMHAHLDDIDFEAVASYEQRFRHDVMAHIHAFGDVAPAARGFIHYGATSAFVTDNADLILMRRGLHLLRATSRRSARRTCRPRSRRRSASAPRLGFRISYSTWPTSITGSVRCPAAA